MTRGVLRADGGIEEEGAVGQAEAEEAEYVGSGEVGGCACGCATLDVFDGLRVEGGGPGEEARGGV